MGQCAVRSFKKHHPDIPLHVVNDDSLHLYEKSVKYLDGAWKNADTSERKKIPGVFKFMVAAEIMVKHKYDKIIILGADTITCARLDEFLDDDEHDILGTLDYPYPLVDGGWLLAGDDEVDGYHLNADVLCIRGTQPLLQMIRESSRFPHYAEQGALNFVTWMTYDSCDLDTRKYSCRIVDGPYETSDVVYNVRSKGNIPLPPDYQGKNTKYPCYEKPWAPFLQKFSVNDGKLYDNNNKHVKVWHYCDGFGSMSDEEYDKIMNNYTLKWFNDETKDFFKEHCDSGDFFEKERGWLE